MRLPRANHLLVLAIFVCFNIAASSTSHPHHPSASRTAAQPSGQMLNLPFGFERNIGQFGPEIKYAARGRGFNLIFRADNAALQFADTNNCQMQDDRSRVSALRPSKQDKPPCSSDSSELISLGFPGSKHELKPVARHPLSSYSNYLVGQDSNKWHTHVSQFGEVWYPDLYPGIDLVYFGTAGQLEYDFVVAPHAQANQISFVLSGTRDNVRVDRDGDLVILVAQKKLFLRKPQIFQGSCSPTDLRSRSQEETHGNCQRIEGGRFRLKNRNLGTEVKFDLPHYDQSKTLVIDPVVSFSTFLGGSLGDGASGMAIDSGGNIYLVGATNSTDFPVSSGAIQSSLAGNSDAFVAKLSSDGSHLIYATYLGGTNAEFPSGIAVDSAGSAYVTGQTYSTDFPVKGAFQAQNLAGPIRSWLN